MRGRQCQRLVFSLREVGSHFHNPAQPNGLTFCIRVTINSIFWDENYSIGEASTSSFLSESWLSGSAKCKSNWHISTFKFVFPHNYCLHFMCVNWQLPSSGSKVRSATIDAVRSLGILMVHERQKNAFLADIWPYPNAKFSTLPDQFLQYRA